MRSENQCRKVATYHHDFSATPETVFPNFCPVREYDWLDGWSCDLLYSDSGVIEEGCIVVTRFFEEVGEETWVCTRHEPPRHLEFVRVGEHAVIQMKSTFSPISASRTTMTLELTATARSPRGEQVVLGLADDTLAQRFRPVFGALDHHLKTGRMLPTAEAAALA